MGFDGLSTNSIGLDDLFILKSNASNGNNLWLKTFNAGVNGIISPRYMYIGPSENLYVFGKFKGSITVGNKTINSVNSNDAFLMKIDNNGNAVWVDYFENGINASYPKVKGITDGFDTFLIFNQNHLVRLNDTNGDILYDKTYDYVEWKSLALQNSNLFVAGYSMSSNMVFGSETIPSINTGFVLKGDKNANFSASVKTSGSTIGSEINDIEFSTDGNLLITGLSVNSMNLISESGTKTYTYNPNSSFESNKLYYYIAKIDSNLSNVSFFRTSSPVMYDSYYPARNVSSRIITGTTGTFKLLLYMANNNSTKFTSFTNPNATTSNPILNSLSQGYRLLISCDSSGNYNSASQPIFYDFMMNSSGVYYTQTTSIGKTYTTKTYNAATSSLVWTKQKTVTNSGSLSKQYQRHLNSAKSDMFFTALVEGKANVFGKQVNNSSTIISRYITRLGPDSLPKWFAKFHQDSGASEQNVSGDFACVDKDDNFLVLCNTAGTSSTFFDAVGNSVDFTQNSTISSKAIIKLDKNGNLLWSKQLLPSTSGNISAAINSDANGDVYIVGTSTQNFNVDGHLISTSVPPGWSSSLGSVFVIKFSSTGNYLYSKVYPNLSAYSLIPVIDAQNNFYLFSEPIYSGANYVFDSITIPSGLYNTDFLMLKFNSSGNVIWGKNFFANNPDWYYAWPNDVVFDGEDFIIMGNYVKNNSSSNFTGLDLVDISRVYPNVTYIPFFAKVTTNGTVIWQNPIHTSVSNTGNYTNIDVDENKNIYMYFYVKDKLNIDGTEYQFDPIKGSKVLLKLDANGNYVYSKILDSATSFNMVDVIENDQINISGYTVDNNVLNYPINNKNGYNLYIGTLGNLTQKYLTPEKNYLELRNVMIENNPNNENSFSFDLINNVNWLATSDQSWLSLSFLNLTGRNTLQNSISGNGDAKITMTATTNNNGSSRTASVIISGDSGVNTSTIIVTQTGTLGTQESKTFVMLLYPNPTSDVLNIQSHEKIIKAEIYDTTGKLILNSKVLDNKISVIKINKGLYFIKLYTEKSVVTSKFIKD